MITALVMGLFIGAGAQGAAVASSTDAGFTAQARAAGLSTDKAAALQAKVDDYLVKLQGRGKQVSPNQISMNGAVLNVTVPGEARPRQLAQHSGAAPQATVCKDFSSWNPVPYGWFCAYQLQWGGGDSIGMYNCDNYFIPWVSEGSWMNNQTTGTVPRLYFRDLSWWDMPSAFSSQGYHVDWNPVNSITNCR
ncbi:hypothetical protein [Streptomyces sp. P3]|uniref:hypothetical protein n=1 Tax=Streptomyces sp. P3 TaxID=2135430 RepID=UPI00131F32D0|nr:hypothetical protein [Streptomyces sp. P3]